MGATLTGVLDSYQKASASTLLNGIVAYWNGEEASGDAIDQVGTLDGVCTSITYHAAGKVNYGYGYNADGDKITIGDVVALELEQFSVSGWMNSTYSWTNLFSIWLSGQGFSVGFNNGYPEVVIGTSPGESATAASQYNDGAWHHWVATYDKITLKLYIDNVLENDHPACSITITYVGTVSYIGFNDTTSTPCILDEIGIWNRALIQSEVTELWNSGTGKTYPFS
jgi:hypothetical protein